MRWRLLTRDPWDSLSRIARVNAPLLVLHGELDPVVPLRFGKKLFAAAAEPKQAIRPAEAPHTKSLNCPEEFEDVLAFIGAVSATLGGEPVLRRGTPRAF